MPDWLEPMAATLTQDRFSGREWLFERKFDGIRLLAYKRGADVRLFSRNRLPQDLPALSKAIAKLHEKPWELATGFDTKLLLDLRKRLDAIEMPNSPFTKANGLPRLRAHWVRPEIVVQAAFIEWTVHGKLRHPRLLGVRFDKNPRDVIREQP